MVQKTGRQAIIEQFLADGITHMFGNPGTVEQGFLDALEAYPDFKYVLCLHESIAVGLADGYARRTKQPTVVQLHTGVGLGNGIGMLYQALRGHAPLIVIAGEAGIKYDAFDAQMAADLVGMARPVTKWAARVVDPASTLRMLRRAVKIAGTAPMGPVFLSLPMDVLDAPSEEEVFPTPRLITQTTPTETQIRRMAEILCGAKRPMLIIGDGIGAAGAQEGLVRVAELAGAEVWGADCSEANIPASHPLYKGQLGHMFGFHSKEITRSADAVLICGTYVFPEVFPSLEGVFHEKAKVLHVDPNAYEIAKNFPVDIGIVADPKATLEQLAVCLESCRTPEQCAGAERRANEHGEEKRARIEREKAADSAAADQTPLRPSAFMEVLARHLPEDAIIFDEALTCSPDLNRYIPADRPGQFFQTRGGSLGVGIPGALGVKTAAPNQTVVGFTGDGGSMYTIQALWTAAHHRIGAKFVICNNGSYRLLKYNIMQYWKERGIPDHSFPSCFTLDQPEIAFEQLSDSLGVPALRVERPDQIEPAVKQMLETDGPFLINLVVSNEVPGHEEPCRCGQ